MKKLCFKGILLSIISLLLLGGCSGGSEDSSSSQDVFTIDAMTAVAEDYQTFQQRDLDYDDVDVDEDDSTYVYKDRENDDSNDVIFYSENSTDTDTEELVVSSAIDINDLYTAFSLDDVTVKVGTTNYSGDYVVIQAKVTGDIYPVLTFNNTPLASNELSDSVYWMSEYRHSNIAVQNRIYLNDSDEQELYAFEFDGDYFSYIDTFAYGDDDYWINDNGDILRQSASDTENFYYYAEDDYSDPLDKDAGQTFLPFLYDGDFYAGRPGNSNIYEVVVFTSTFSFTYDSSWSNTDDYEAATGSAMVGNYEMSSDCVLYEFNNDDPDSVSIDFLNDFSGYDVADGELAVAGQDALFCVYSDGGDAAILKYDTTTSMVTAYVDSTLPDGLDSVIVISDNEVMFSEATDDSINEYYIDLESEETTAIEVAEPSIVLLQRLAN